MMGNQKSRNGQYGYRRGALLLRMKMALLTWANAKNNPFRRRIDVGIHMFDTQ